MREAIPGYQPPTGAALHAEGPAAAMTQLCVFQPPPALASGLELWCVATGPEGWGGAVVLLAEDDDHYAGVGTVRRGHIGVLRDELPAETWLARPVRVAMAHGGGLEFWSIPALLRRQSLCLVGWPGDYELVAYSAARLVGAESDGTHLYAVSGPCLRGLYGTGLRTWSAGTPWCRLDEGVCRIRLEGRLAGWPVYLKFPAINAYGEGPESAQDDEPVIVHVAARAARGG